jgi:23S rRNA (cytosine1962-C5)-methyltransferase
MGTIILKKNREASLLRRHPWIFSGAIKEIHNVSKNGETVEILNDRRERLAWGSYSATSQIAVRVLSFLPDAKITSEFFHQQLSQAIHQRSHLKNNSTTASRLVYAESDGLPGVIVDQYSDILVCQFLSAGAEYWKNEIILHLRDIISPQGIYERSDADVRLKENLIPTQGVLWGQVPPGLISIQENNLQFAVDIHNGHKTGFYLDQADNRAILAYYTRDMEVLNCFAYSGGFGVYALKGGARSLINVDSAANILELAAYNIKLNFYENLCFENLTADVFQLLRTFRDARRQFDVIILDPPKFAESAHQINQASRGYKDINLLAFKLLRPGGFLFTFSCSGHIHSELFQKIIADAALDAGRVVHIERTLSQTADHPIALHFPESRYLKGFVCRVM